MSSKYIKNTTPKQLWSNYTNLSMSSAEKKEQKERENYKNHLKSEKQRIESIPLEQLSFIDLYKFPFHQAKYGTWVYDANNNFIFQFQVDNKEVRERAIAILNDEYTPTKNNKFVHEDGMIYLEKDGERKEFILIRGWGNLTGVGAYNLDGEWAGKIQDTLAEYIAQKLSN